MEYQQRRGGYVIKGWAGKFETLFRGRLAAIGRGVPDGQGQIVAIMETHHSCLHLES
jgi:hypothetical protein